MTRIAILLLAAHALCDISLQTPYLVDAKRDRVSGFPGYLALLYHASIHAGAVLLITGSNTCALLELTAHWTIDALKCREAIGSRLDQTLHLACKGIYLCILFFGL